MSRLRSTRGRFALVAAALVVALAIAVLSRQGAADTHTPFNPDPTSDRLVIGVVTSTSPSDREVARGLKLWVDALGDSGGLPYGDGSVAAVEVDAQRSGPTPQDAAAAARTLLGGKHVSVLVGPTDPDQLAAVAEVAVQSRALLFSARPRPVQSRDGRSLTYVPRGNPDSLHATLDIVDRLVKRKGGGAKDRGRVLILFKRGTWGLRALRGANEARRRGYKTKTVAVSSTGALDGVLRSAGRADFTAVYAPPREAVSWFKAGGRDPSPWALVADETTAIEPALGSEKVAVEVPWSTSQNFGDGLFGPGGFTRAYDAAFGGTPPTDAVAGASVGVILRAMVAKARSTDPTRLLEARDAAPIFTPLGPLVFRSGQPRAVPSVVVLLSPGHNPFTLSPDRKSVAVLRTSVPPRSRPAAPATGATAPTTTGAVPAPGTTTTPGR
jgi:hypothetical protein